MIFVLNIVVNTIAKRVFNNLNKLVEYKNRKSRADQILIVEIHI